MWKLDEIPRKNERGLKNKYSRTVWRTAGATEGIWGKANSKDGSIFLNGEGGGKSLENTMPFEIRFGQSFTEHFTLEMWPCTYSEENVEMWKSFSKMDGSLFAGIRPLGVRPQVLRHGSPRFLQPWGYSHVCLSCRAKACGLWQLARQFAGDLSGTLPVSGRTAFKMKCFHSVFPFWPVVRFWWKSISLAFFQTLPICCREIVLHACMTVSIQRRRYIAYYQ